MRYPAPRLSALAAIVLTGLLAGCTSDDGGSEVESPRPAATRTQVPVGPLSDEQVTEALDDFLQAETFGGAATHSLNLVVDAQDTRFVSVLIEMLNATHIGVINGGPDPEVLIRALEELSGQDFGDDAFAWVEWYGESDLEPPPGFTTWKGKLLGEIDPRFAEFLRSDHPATIRTEEILWGGVLVDGIPPLDNPAMLPAEAASYLVPEEPVFGLSVNGEARAYPLRIMDWHEMANDVVGGVPVSLAYCTLCGAGIAYDGRAEDGTVYTFGTSGFLYRSNKLMYDRNTGTLWNQFTGRPVLGPLAAATEDGTPAVELLLLPLVLTSWEDWLAEHPDTLVLSLETGHERTYELGSAYGHYFSDSSVLFPVPGRGDALEDKARVFGLRVEGVPRAYELEALIAEGVLNDAVGGVPVVLVAPSPQVNVEGQSRRIGEVAYNAGAEVRAYARGEHSFAAGPASDLLLDATGATWTVTEDALESPAGERLERLGGHLAYWFGWSTFFPNATLYSGSPG